MKRPVRKRRDAPASAVARASRTTARRRAPRAASALTPPRRRDILDRAAQLMQEKGYGGISAQDIADALGFSKANFFYHVKSKEDLLYHIFVDTLQFTIDHLEQIMTRDAAASEKLRALIDLYVRLMTDHAAVMQVWFKEKAHLSPEHAAAVSRLERRIRALVDEFYTAAIRRGEVRDVDPRVARIAMFGMCFALTRWPELRIELSLPALTTQMQQLACGALLRDDA